MLRLFVGIALPPEQCLTLSVICRGIPGVKWVDPGNYHVTLRFIGDVDEGVAGDIDGALSAIRLAPFDLAVAGTGCFGPDDKPRVLFAGLDQSIPLDHLHLKVETALMRIGLLPEGRRFTPHITLGAVRGGNPIEIGRFLAAHSLVRLPTFRVEAFHLVRSYLTKAGSIYEDVAQYRLR
ncbi:MAG: 2,3-cyclic 3-phosphodiesterase [Aliidongia sp.]|jgi:2'-5' RNA ligase|nr:2,3-cyclic 3-phosphodiesterase [Aliidongia sp.]